MLALHNVVANYNNLRHDLIPNDVRNLIYPPVSCDIYCFNIHNFPSVLFTNWVFRRSLESILLPPSENTTYRNDLFELKLFLKKCWHVLCGDTVFVCTSARLSMRLKILAFVDLVSQYVCFQIDKKLFKWFVSYFLI